jgi:hypothetical protein
VPKPRLFTPGAIKQLFRAVVEALTGKTPPPQPTQRRKRTEETRGGFKLARTAIRRVKRPPPRLPPPEMPLYDAEQHFWGE